MSKFISDTTPKQSGGLTGGQVGEKISDLLFLAASKAEKLST